MSSWGQNLSVILNEQFNISVGLVMLSPAVTRGFIVLLVDLSAHFKIICINLNLLKWDIPLFIFGTIGSMHYHFTDIKLKT